MAKVLDENSLDFAAFIKQILSGVDPETLEVPDCGQWHDYAELFKYEYEQRYGIYDTAIVIEKIKKCIQNEMNKDSDMHDILGSLFLQDTVLSANAPIPDVDELDVLEEGSITQILKRYDFPKLKKMSYTRKNDGVTIFADPILPEGTGKHALKFINRFEEWAAEYAAWSHPWFLRGTAIWILSLVAARRIYLNGAAENYTPIYSMFVAKSSEYSKSFAPKLAMALLKACGLQNFLVPNNMTPPMYMIKNNPVLPEDYESLDEFERATADFDQMYAGKKSMLFDEMGARWTSMLQPNGTYSAYLEWLLSLDDCPDELAYHTAKHGEKTIKDPYMTVLGSMTIDDFRASPKGSANPFKRGLMGRFFVWSPAPPIDPSFEVTILKTLDVPDDLKEMLHNYHEALGNPVMDQFIAGQRVKTVEYPKNIAIITPEVDQAFTAYLQALKMMLHDPETKELIPEDLVPSYFRLPMKALRIAAMLAFMHNGGKMTLEEWGAGQYIAEQGRESLHEFYRQLNNASGEMSEGRKNEDRLLRHIRDKGYWVKPYEIAPYMGMPTKAVLDMLESLRIAGALECVEVIGKNGRISKVYCDPSAPVPDKYKNIKSVGDKAAASKKE